MEKILLLFCLFFTSLAFAGDNNDDKSLVLQEKYMTILAPPVINKDYYSLEFGFLTKKKFKNYHYNAFVTVNLFEDWKDQPGKVRAGALGFRGGVILPTQNKIPLYVMMSLGFAKTTLHENPIFGKEEQALAKKDMLYAEAGLLYKIDKYLVRLAYQRATAKYFHRHLIFSMGVTY